MEVELDDLPSSQLAVPIFFYRLLQVDIYRLLEKAGLKQVSSPLNRYGVLPFSRVHGLE